MSQSDGGLSPGRGIILRFNNHLQGSNLLNKKFMEGELLGRQPPIIFGLAQLGDHFEGNTQSNLRREADILRHGLGVDRRRRQQRRRLEVVWLKHRRWELERENAQERLRPYSDRGV
jgi:hypothetical protein